MGNTEYFELCEISSKIQCPDFSLYWEAGIENCEDCFDNVKVDMWLDVFCELLNLSHRGCVGRIVKCTHQLCDKC